MCEWGQKSYCFYHETAIVQVSCLGCFSNEERYHIKMEEKSVWSLDFSDCAPITSPSKQAKVNYVQEENDSSSDEGEDSLVSH